MNNRISLRWLAYATILYAMLPGHPSVADGADTKQQVEAGLFDSTQLLDVRIEMAAKDWLELSAQRRDFAESFSKTAPVRPYTYFRANISINGYEIRNVGIRKKGFFGSMDSRRPSLKVKFDEFQKNAPLAGLDRLTLNNNKQDQAHVSQILSYAVFRKAGLPAPRCSLAKVVVNGQSLGIYGNVESIKKPFLKREFGDDSGDMFEGVFPCDFLVDRIERFEIKTNKKNADRKDLMRIATILDNPNESLEEQLSKYFDIDEFVRHWATEVMIGFWDGYAGNQNNYFLYKNPKDHKYHLIPWGADFAFSSQFQRGPKSIKAKGLMAFELYQKESIRKRYRTELLRLLDTIWDEEQMLAEVKRVGAIVKGHLHEDQAGYSRAAENVTTFIKNRRDEIKNEIKDGPVEFSSRPSKPMYYKQVGSISGDFTTLWKDERSAETSGTANLTVRLDGKAVTFVKQTAKAEPGRVRGFGRRPGSTPSGPGPPTIVIKLIPESKDAKPLNLTLTIAADQFRSSKEPLRIQGMMTEGEGGFGFGPGMRSLVGQVTLTSAERRDGSKVSGQVQGKLFQMRGGFGGRRR